MSPFEAEASDPGVDNCSRFSNPVLQVEAECCRALDKMSDLVIMVQGEAFASHRLVLAAASPFFASMFTNGMKETNLKEIVLKEVDKESWRVAMAYLYEGKLEMKDVDHALDFLQVTGRFALRSMERSIIDFIGQHLNEKNCWKTFELAERFGLTELKMNAKSIIGINFLQARSSNLFYSYSLDLVKEIVHDKNLVIRTEMDIFDAITGWVAFCKTNDGEQRMKSLRDMLFTAVKFERMNFGEISRCVQTAFRMDFPKQIIERMSGFLTTGNHPGNILENSYRLPKKRYSKSFTFTHTVYGFTAPHNDEEDEEVDDFFTPWVIDEYSKQSWSLHVYPKRESEGDTYLALYLKVKREVATVDNNNIVFQLFLVEPDGKVGNVCTENIEIPVESLKKKGRGFPQFIPTTELLRPPSKFINPKNDSIIVGASVFFEPNSYDNRQFATWD